MSFRRCALRSAGGQTAGKCVASTMMLASHRNRRPDSREAERAPAHSRAACRSDARLLLHGALHLALTAKNGGA
jgi:hypothetical protein